MYYNDIKFSYMAWIFNELLGFCSASLKGFDMSKYSYEFRDYWRYYNDYDDYVYWKHEMDQIFSEPLEIDGTKITSDKNQIIFQKGKNIKKFMIPDLTISPRSVSKTYGEYTWDQIITRGEEVVKLIEENETFSRFKFYFDQVRYLHGMILEVFSREPKTHREETLEDILKRVQKAKEDCLSVFVGKEGDASSENVRKQIDDESRKVLSKIISACDQYVDMVKKHKSSALIMGTFLASTNGSKNITIYPETIKKIDEETMSENKIFLEDAAMIHSVFLHEAPHALHYCYIVFIKSCDSNFYTKTKNNGKRFSINKATKYWYSYKAINDKASTVKETLATCLEYEWLKTFCPGSEKTVSEKLENQIQPTYPYAGAKEYLKLDHPFAVA